MQVLAALFTFLLLYGNAHALNITHDEGGNIQEYIKILDNLHKEHVPIVISGECYSSCTLALKYDNVCVMPQAVLGFHRAILAIRDDDGTVYPIYDSDGNIVSPDKPTAVLASAIPPEVKEKLKPLTLKFQTVKGKDLPARYLCEQHE